MAVSVYDPSGRLKKHALLGTSFAVDPTQAEKRRKFLELYEEARTGGAKGREATREKLSARLKGYEQEQAGRLAQIAEKKKGFEEQLAELKTPEQRLSEIMFTPPMGAPAPGEYAKFVEKRKRELLGQYQQEYGQKTRDIGTAYTAAQEEEEERLRRLSDKLELYNLFLGA